jgi:hypothetical protein
MRWIFAVLVDGEVVLWLALVGSNQGREAAQRALAAAIARPEALLLENAAAQRPALSFGRRSSSAALQDAFDWAKPTSTTCAEVEAVTYATRRRQASAGRPAPVSLSGIGAGFPDTVFLRRGWRTRPRALGERPMGDGARAPKTLRRSRRPSTAPEGRSRSPDGAVYYGSTLIPAIPSDRPVCDGNGALAMVGRRA